MKKGFITEYPMGNRMYGSYIIAKDIAEATMLAEKRGLGETILSSRTTIKDLILTPNEVRRTESITPAILHAVCFLSFIGSKAKVLNDADVLGDNGCLHELIHELSNTGDKKMSELKRMIYSLIKTVPGVY